MTITVSPTIFDINVLLRRFVRSILPEGIEVIKGQDNRVPQPLGEDYCVFWPLRQERIETNTDRYIDLKFIGTIDGNILTIDSVEIGGIPLCDLQAIERKLKWLIERAHRVLQRIEAGHFRPDDAQYVAAIDKIPEIDPRKLFGIGVQPGTKIVKKHETIPNAYYLNKTHDLTEPQVFSAGIATVLQPVQMTYQLDVYGPSSGENVTIVSTLFRDPYGVANYMGWPPQGFLLPLYASDPRMLAFVNQEKQYELRWTIELVMQANMITRNVPQQFADHLQLLLTDVDGYAQSVVAAPPPPAPWEPGPGARVMKLQRLLDELHRKIKYIHQGMLGVV